MEQLALFYSGRTQTTGCLGAWRVDEKIFWKEGNVLYFVIQGCAFAKLTELYNFFFFFYKELGFVLFF